MKNVSSVPLHRQYLSRFVSIIALIITLLICIGFMFFQRGNQFHEIVNVEYPNTLATIAYEQQAQHVLSTSKAIQQLKTASTIESLHQQFEEGVMALNQLAIPAYQPKIDYKKLNQSDQKSLSRLAETSEFNDDLLREAISELRRLGDLLALYENNAATKDERVVILNLKTQWLLEQLYQLNLQSDSFSVETLSEQATLFFVDYNESKKSFFALTDVIEMNLSVQKLEKLLFSEQNVVGKWRSSLRLYEEYLNAITTYQQEIMSSLLQVQGKLANKLQYQSNDNNSVVFELDRLVENANISITAQHVQQFIYGLISLIFVILMVLLANLYRAIKVSNHKQVSLISSLLDTEHADITIDNAELGVIAEKISSLHRPEFTDDDFRNVCAEFTRQLHDIAEFNQLALWRFDNGKICFVHAKHVLSLMPELEINQNFSTIDDKKHADRIYYQHALKQHWRHFLTADSCKKIISTLKVAKKERVIQSIHIETRHNLSLLLTFNFQQGEWLGTLINAEKTTQLTDQVDQVTHQLNQQLKQQSLVNEQHNISLSNMLVRAMLQSQHVAVVSGVSMPPVYRQLVRIFDWQQQLLLKSTLTRTEKTRVFHDVKFIDAIQACLMNVMAETQLQQHQVFLDTDPNLLTDAKVDLALLQHIIQLAVRIMLSDQFKAQLVLTLQPVDQNAGQQRIKFSVHVFLEDALKNLPPLVAQLTQNNATLNEEQSSEQLTIFNDLLNLGHGELNNVELTEQGYQLSFELPIAAAKTQPHVVETPQLKQANVLLLSQNTLLRKTVSHHIVEASGRIECVSDASLFTENYSINSLTRKKLDVILLADDQWQYYQTIEQHIAQLPASKQAKIMVLQTPFNNALHIQGLFSQSICPLFMNDFITDIQHLLAGQATNNLVIKPEKLAQFSGRGNQIEILVAIETVAKHQLLWRILQWLGFQVTLVSQAEEMMSHWQTGRYLVLISDFEQSVFNDQIFALSMGQTIARGFFHLDDNIIQTIKEKQVTIANLWHVDFLPAINDIDVLVRLLTPWLTELPQHLSDIGEKQAVTDSSKPENRVVQNDHQTGKSQNTVKSNINRKEQVLFDSQLLDSLPSVFDLEKYAKNQGSAELAAFMLDDYLMALDNGIEVFEHHIITRDHQALLGAVSELDLIANILAAKNLQQITAQLKQGVTDNAYSTMTSLTKQAAQEIEAIKVYAEAI